MTRIGVMLAFGFLLSGLGFSAVAQQPTQAQANAVRQSCRGDYQSYCANVPTGGRASLQCLQEHLVDLTPPCQSAVSAAEGGPVGAGAARGSGPAAQAGHPPPCRCGRKWR